MILALDIGLNLGWAAGAPEESFVSGTARFSSTGEDMGRLLFNFREWLRRKADEFSVDGIVCEKPIHVPTNDLRTLETMYSMAGIAAVVCKDICVPFKRQPMGEVRKAILGWAQAPRSIPQGKKREWVKKTIVAYCIERGWNPNSDHAADALVNLEFAVMERYPAYAAHNAGPLQTRGVA